MPSREAQAPWWRDPDWLGVLISAFQLFVITVGGGTLVWLNERAAERREILVLETRLADRDPDVYKPAIEALTLKIGPKALVRHVDKVNNGDGSCLPWRKARHLHSMLTSSSTSAEEVKPGVQLLWRSWACLKHHIGMDVELYEIMKSGTPIQCSLFLSEVDRAPRNLLKEAALLNILENTCSTNASASDEFVVLKSNFSDDLQREIDVVQGKTKEITFTTFFAWDRGDLPEGPFAANRDSWSHVVLGIRNLFETAGPSGLDVLWNQLDYAPLQSRIIFGYEVLYGKSEAPTEWERRLSSWARVGLVSPQPEDRVAAIAAVGQFRFDEHLPIVKKLAESDQDWRVRQKAMNVLAQRGLL